ncbi:MULTISPECIES: hypothetical protein [unclassified Chromohalobacter]|uniref:hypothetical protein n=1 Tax=unclassified Chromohalobacter TaxID=2628571 RepID=UPI002469C4B9|nr:MULTISPECIES: hypothetical protein [unclassified Chromohalobacter]
MEPDIQSVLFNSAVSVGASLLVGVILFKAATVKGQASAAKESGRKFAAYAIFIGTIITLPSFFSSINFEPLQYSVEPIAQWIIACVAYGLIGYFIGWIYWKLFKRQKNH